VSDITKKIFSIEPEMSGKSEKLPVSEIIRPMLVEDVPPPEAKKEAVPDFVTRDSIKPLTAPPSLSELDDPASHSSAMGWFILGFGVLYLVGAGLYFGMPLLNTSAELFSIAGLVLILALPLVLLLLLWRSLRHLKQANQYNVRFAKAAEILVSPDGEALGRTKTLAAGIQTEITKVNDSLSATVDTLTDVQLSVTRETQSIDAAGLQLSSRSDDVGRNLTLQRQALESISGTFDTRMGTLSTQITDTSDTLDAICAAAEEKLLKASESLQLASGKMDQTVAEGSNRIRDRITEIGDISLKLEETTKSLSTDLETSTQTLADTDQGLLDKTLLLQELNSNTQTKLIDLQNTINEGNQMLTKLQEAAESRDSFVQSYYQDLSAGLKQSENETLAAQGKTARMVESNLAQMRQNFSTMETDLQALQSKLDALKTSSPTPISSPEIQQSRLKLEPLDSDFPPVEPTREVPKLRPASTLDTPMNLGLDMMLDSPEAEADAEIVGFEPDVLRRPGDAASPSSAVKSTGFGRKSEKQDKSGWRWRDMLGSLDRPDPSQTSTASLAPALGAAAFTPNAPEKVDAVEILSMLQLSPSAIVDEGTVIDATQARINAGEAGLVKAVSGRLPEAISHLRDKMAGNPQLAANLKRYCNDFSNQIGNTPPTAPSLRAALGSPDGRAYLLAVTALKA